MLVSVDGSNHACWHGPATIEEAVQSAVDFSSPVASAWLRSMVTQIDCRNGTATSTRQLIRCLYIYIGMRVSQPMYDATGVLYSIPSACVYRMLTGACNPMMCAIPVLMLNSGMFSEHRNINEEFDSTFESDTSLISK